VRTLRVVVLTKTMPRDLQNCYWVEGAFRHRSITRTTRAPPDRTRNSLPGQTILYPTTTMLIDRMDAVGDDWYRDTAPDLYVNDFVWLTRLQSARRMTQRADRFPYRDRVLERLMEEGVFDREDQGPRHPGEAAFMGYSASLSQRLLMRIESLEDQVSTADLSIPLASADMTFG